MKALPILLMFSTLVVLSACGKKNESGKNNNQGPCIQFGPTGQCNQYSTLPGGINPGLGVNVNLSQIVAQIPCESGAMGMPMNRNVQMVQLNTNTITTAGHSYLGVTSYGDVAIIVGNGTKIVQASLYMCNGQMAGTQAGPILLGEYVSETCPVKVISSGAIGYRTFRDPRGGQGTRGPGTFAFCR